MDSTQFKKLVQKAATGNASEEEKQMVLKELNFHLEKYNRALKEALKAIPKQ